MNSHRHRLRPPGLLLAIALIAAGGWALLR